TGLAAPSVFALVLGAACGRPPAPADPPPQVDPRAPDAGPTGGSAAGGGEDGGVTDAGIPERAAGASFDEDLVFLSSHGPVLVLTDPDGAKVALSAKYQARVMTSAVAASAKSLGW